MFAAFFPYDAHAADLLSQVVSRRYQEKSIVVITNLGFKRRGSVLPNAACAVALIDRQTLHAEVVATEGESYRGRDGQAHQKRQRPPK